MGTEKPGCKKSRTGTAELDLAELCKGVRESRATASTTDSLNTLPDRDRPITNTLKPRRACCRENGKGPKVMRFSTGNNASKCARLRSKGGDSRQ